MQRSKEDQRILNSYMKLALLQINVINELSACDAYFDKAHSLSAEIAIMPEMWYGGFDYTSLERRARECSSVEKSLQAFAIKYKIGIIGTIPEYDKGKIFNCMLFIDKMGKVHAKYRKHFLFQPTNEDKYFAAGTYKFTSAKIDNTTFGAAICYELRFPEVLRLQALVGIDIAVIPAQWPMSRINQWKSLITARAIENVCFVVAVNGVGISNGVKLGGNSMVVDPLGRLLINLDESETIKVVDINIDLIDEVKSTIPVLENLREADFYISQKKWKN